MIIVKGFKIVWFDNVFGWVMTGIISPDNKWFFGLSINNNKQNIKDLNNKDKV